MGKKRNACRILVGKPESMTTRKTQTLMGRSYFKWIIEKDDGVIWTGFIWLRIGTSGRLL
jgi:hypothetical protein